MRDGFRILDLDRHMIEPMSVWGDRFPASQRHLVPHLRSITVDIEALDPRLGRLGIPSVGDEPLMVGVSPVANVEVARIAAGRAELFQVAQTGAGQLWSMDATGVDQAVLL